MNLEFLLLKEHEAPRVLKKSHDVISQKIGLTSHILVLTKNRCLKARRSLQTRSAEGGDPIGESEGFLNELVLSLLCLFLFTH